MYGKEMSDTLIGGHITLLFTVEKDGRLLRNQGMEERYKNEIVGFKGKKGTIFIYNTWGVHRAKPTSNSEFVRKSLFFQGKNRSLGQCRCIFYLASARW